MNADISDCGNYRYWLTRNLFAFRDSEITNPLTPHNFMVVMLNPSTADSQVDDPTVKRCISFGDRLGAQHLIVLNLFAYRTTRPSVLKSVEDPVGPLTDTWIKYWLLRMPTKSDIVCAWGSHGSLFGRGRTVAKMIQHVGHRPLCFGMTKKGHPRHPLYLPKSAPLQVLDSY